VVQAAGPGSKPVQTPSEAVPDTSGLVNEAGEMIWDSKAQVLLSACSSCVMQGSPAAAAAAAAVARTGSN
jgi:hypothetical protein